MAKILRAGPWSSYEDQFLNEPEDLLDTSVSPVNCANSFSATWPWQCIHYTNQFDTLDEEATLETTESSLTFTDSITTGSGVATAVYFSYQATEDWSFTSGTIYANGAYGWAEIYVDGESDVYETEDIDLANIVFPAAVVPVEVLLLSITTDSGEDSSITFTL